VSGTNGLHLSICHLGFMFHALKSCIPEQRILAAGA
jgi:hypothetical protein